MDFSTLTITELIAVISFLFGILFGIAKFYAVFTRLDNTLGKLEKAIAKLEKTQVDYGKELATIKAEIKHIFKQIGGSK
nr:hypothetical protein [Enterococcus innesii]